MRKIKWSIIILLMISFVSCTEGNEINFNKVVEEINLANENILIPNIDITELMSDLDEDEMVDIVEFNGLFEYKDLKREVSKEEMNEDIELYFKLLRSAYAPYNYFGGDEVFFEVKNNVLEYIDSQEVVNSIDVALFLKEEFDFIEDNHFEIESGIHIKSKNIFTNNEIEYFKDELGFYRFNNGKKQYVKSIDGDEEVEEYFKLSIGEDGKLVYNIYKLIENENEYSDFLLETEYKINVLYEGNEALEEILIKVIGNKSNGDGFSFTLDVIENIPVIAIREMPFEGTEVTEAFLESAEKYKESEIAIVDLRDNEGGNGALPGQWIEKMFGEVPKDISKGIFLDRYKMTEEAISFIDIEAQEEYLQIINKYLTRNPINEYYMEFETRESEELISNDNLLFVLVDKDTGSAGEYFIEKIRGIENVVVVGTNTYGALKSSSLGPLYLPNSGISFTYGNWLKIYDEEVFEEGKGFMPDILVDDDIALEKVLEMIEYYDLN